MTQAAPPSTSLVGRQEALAALVARLDQPGLVTLTGPGGVGKTWLAVHAMHEVESEFPNGQWFCDLAALPPGGPVETTVATTLGIDVQQGERTADRIVSYLAPRRALVVLDNCEHVLDAVADLLSRILKAAPATTVLATSRERLRVVGEQNVPVDPLDASYRDSDTMRLFEDRARSANPSFTLPREDADAAELCRMLGGLPLAIEIAATASATRTPADLLGELRSGGGQLAGERQRPTRHASLHAVVAWSYDLLDPVDAEIFEHLAVFHAAGWYVDAAAAVADPERDVAIDDALVRLAEHCIGFAQCGCPSATTRTGRHCPAEQEKLIRLNTLLATW